MKAGDKVYRAAVNHRDEIEVTERTIRNVRKDGVVMLNGDGGKAWGYGILVPAASCNLNPADAAMDYLQRCNAALDDARATVGSRERAVDAARAFAVQMEREWSRVDVCEKASP